MNRRARGTNYLKDAGFVRLIIFVVVFLLIALLGGSARADAAQGLYLRPIIVLSLVAVGLLQLEGLNWRLVRAPLILLGAFAATMLIQLIPFPAGFGPSNEGSIRSFAAALDGSSWTLLSLTPDRTWNALVALLVPIAVLLAYVGISSRYRALLLGVVLGVALLSALLGLLQVVGGSSSVFYTYEITNRGVPTGLFANRNHQAALLAISLPLLRMFALVIGRRDARLARPVVVVSLALAGFFALMVLVTGSRAGLILLGLGFFLALFIDAPVSFRRPADRLALYLKGGIAVGFLSLLGLTFAFGRALSIVRFGDFNGSDGDLRVSTTPILIDLARKLQPTGAGYGAFDRIFRSVEPDALLRSSYFNNAHNDLLELAITGGLPALLVLFAFILWWGYASFQVFTAKVASSSNNGGRAASAAILILLLASATDYPLRTPLMAALFALLCALLAEAQSSAKMVASRPERL